MIVTGPFVTYFKNTISWYNVVFFGNDFGFSLSSSKCDDSAKQHIRYRTVTTGGVCISRNAQKTCIRNCFTRALTFRLKKLFFHECKKNSTLEWPRVFLRKKLVLGSRLEWLMWFPDNCAIFPSDWVINCFLWIHLSNDDRSMKAETHVCFLACFNNWCRNHKSQVLNVHGFLISKEHRFVSFLLKESFHRAVSSLLQFATSINFYTKWFRMHIWINEDAQVYPWWHSHLHWATIMRRCVHVSLITFYY